MEIIYAHCAKMLFSLIYISSHLPERISSYVKRNTSNINFPPEKWSSSITPKLIQLTNNLLQELLTTVYISPYCFIAWFINLSSTEHIPSGWVLRVWRLGGRTPGSAGERCPKSHVPFRVGTVWAPVVDSFYEDSPGYSFQEKNERIPKSACPEFCINIQRLNGFLPGLP